MSKQMLYFCLHHQICFKNDEENLSDNESLVEPFRISSLDKNDVKISPQQIINESPSSFQIDKFREIESNKNHEFRDHLFWPQDTAQQIWISSGICIPFKENSNFKSNDEDSPFNSDISADSFDSVKRINKEENEETSTLTLKFLEKVNEARINKNI